MKNYLLIIEELIDQSVINEELIAFDMNKVVDNARNGNTSLLEQLYLATKVRILKYENRIVTQTCICTPKKGRTTKDIIKQKIGRIVPNHEELVGSLVDFHNTTCSQTGKQEVSIDEIQALHQATQEDPIM